MTSTVFTKKFATNAGISQAKARAYLKAIEGTIADVLKDEDSFAVAGLSIKKKNVPEHQGRNPSTGEAITIPAKNRVAVKAGSAIKAAANS